eukprot:7912438-Lingulodinium_polyedra.AAC.1
MPSRPSAGVQGVRVNKREPPMSPWPNAYVSQSVSICHIGLGSPFSSRRMTVERRARCILISR